MDRRISSIRALEGNISFLFFFQLYLGVSGSIINGNRLKFPTGRMTDIANGKTVSLKLFNLPKLNPLNSDARLFLILDHLYKVMAAHPGFTFIFSIFDAV